MDHNKQRDNEPIITIEGLDVIIKRDLEKHQALLERSKQEKLSYVEARSHEIKRKRAWRKHIGNGKFDDDSLNTALDQIVQNITMYSDKVKLSDDAIAHHGEIVETLTGQLENYYANIALAAKVGNSRNANSD